MQVDHYQILELQAEATPAEVRTAYFKLAKQLHPDRQATHDPAATERFLAVQNAYQVLIDPTRREEFDRQRIAAGTGTTATATKAEEAPKPKPKSKAVIGTTLEEERDARMAYHKARNLFASDNAERALRAMHAVVKTVPDNPDYRSFLGYLMAHEGDRLHAARDHCRKAVEAEPYNPDFHAHLGYVYIRAGLANTAQECFDRALQLDAKHEMAREFASKNGGSGGEGLMGSLKRFLRS